MKKFLSYLLLAALCITSLTACGKEPAKADNSADLTAAKDYLYSMYKDKQGTTASDFERVAVINIEGVAYNVTWAADSAEVKVVPGDKFTTIDVNEQTSVEVNYKLTATIADADGNTITQEFTHNIPAYKETSWAEYVAAADGETVIVKGVVTAIISKANGNSSNCLYFEDADGAYYVYNMATDPVDMGVEIGMTVKCTGTRATYSGQYEITDSNVEIISTDKTPVTPVDITDKFMAAKDLKDASITEKQGSLVTLKNVIIQPSVKSDEDSGYYKFALGDKISYARISSSVCPIVKDKDTFIKNFKEHTGYYANVTGLITLYDGAFYISPVSVDCYEYLTLSDAEFEAVVEPEADMSEAQTLAEAFALEEGAALVGTQVLRGTVTKIETPYDEKYGNISLWIQVGDKEVEAYRLNGGAELQVGDVITVAGNLKNYKGTVEFDAKCTYSKDLSVDEMKQAKTLEEAFALGEGEALSGRRVVSGTITKIETAYDEKYGNVSLWIQAGDKEVEAYRLNGGADLKVGDVITVTGFIKNYKGTVEFDAKCEYVMGNDFAGARAKGSLTDAFALEEGAALNYESTLTGAITKIETAYDEKYGNISLWIQVGDKEVEAYRLIGGAELQVGDVITVTGYIKNYKGTVEFDAKCTYTK